LTNLVRERAALARRMAGREQDNEKLAMELEKRAREYSEDARLVRQILNGGAGGPEPDEAR